MILLKNGTVVLENTSINADVLICGGKIEKVGKSIAITEDVMVIDCTDLHVMCGFVDLHAHLREPGGEHKETIFSGTKAAVKGGYTTIAAMPNTTPVNDNSEICQYILGQARKADNCKVLAVGAMTKGLGSDRLCDYDSMFKAGISALSDDGQPALNAKVLYDCLIKAGELNIPVFCHSEDKSLSAGGVVNLSENTKKHGLAGISASSEAIGIARDIILAEELDCKIHICHVSTAIGLELIRSAKQRGVKVTCETAPHYFSLDDSIVDGSNPNLKVNPPIRTQADVAAVIKAIKDGTIDAIATDHAPHSEAEKQKGMTQAPFGISGLETSFAVCYTYLVAKEHITLNRLSQLLSSNPLKILRFVNSEIKKGAVADITVVDTNEKWIVDKDKFVSKGKNTPYEKKLLIGRVKLTIVDGVIKFDDAN